MKSYLAISIFVLFVPGFVYTFCSDYEVLDISSAQEDKFIRTISGNIVEIALNNGKNDTNKCIGDVVDGNLVITKSPGTPGNYDRRVCIIKNDSADFSESIHVYTKNGSLPVRERYMKVSSEREDRYERVHFKAVDVDLCSDLIINDTEVSLKFQLKDCEVIGAIKCKSEILIDGVDVFERTITKSVDGLTVTTLPSIGDEFKLTLVPINGGKYRLKSDCITLDVSQDPSRYSDVAVSCGKDCIFYDGCGHSTSIVDVVDGNSIIFSDVLTRCLSVKIDRKDNCTFLTVYNKHFGSERTSVAVFMSKGSGDYIEVNRKYITLDLNSVKSREFISVDRSENKIRFFISNGHGSLHTIGKVLYNGKYIDVVEGLYQRVVTRESDLIIIDDILSNGEFRHIIYKSNGENFNIYKSKPLMIKIETLTRSTKDINVIRSYDGYYNISSGSFYNKIGTIKCGDVVVEPNRYNVLELNISNNGYEMVASGLTSDGRRIYTKYTMCTPIFDENKPIYIQNGRDFITLEINKFLPNEHLAIVDLGDYLKFDVRNIITKTIGNVTFNGNIVVPQDPQLTSRTIYLNKFTYHFIIVSCDVNECTTDVYQIQSRDGIARYSIVDKMPISVDLTKGHDMVSIITDGDYKFYRIKNQPYKYKIGDILYNGEIIVPDSRYNFTRMINLYYPKESKVVKKEETSEVKGKIRVLNVERWYKSTKLYDFKISGASDTSDPFPLVESSSNYPSQKSIATPRDRGKVKTSGKGNDSEMLLEETALRGLSLDMGLGMKREGCILMKQYYSVIEYYINWQLSDDYKLDSIDITGPDNKTKVILKKIMSLSNVNVRLHPRGDDLYIAIENIPKDLPKPTNYDYYPLIYSKETNGMILQYNITTFTKSTIDRYPPDLFTRNTFTNYFHKFNQYDDI